MTTNKKKMKNKKKKITRTKHLMGDTRETFIEILN